MRRRSALVLAAALLSASACSAQAMSSEHAVSAQTVDGTTITVEFYRPKARGRALFGSLVPWGVPWTPGANWATTIDVDHDVRVNGQALPKGKYTIWAIPQQAEWTIIFDRRERVFHTRGPSASDEQMRVTTHAETVPFTEMLTWSFPLVQRDGTTLQLAWGTTSVALTIDVPGSK